MARKKYSDDYELVISEDEQGREKRTAVYRGDYFEIDLDQKGIAKFRYTCILLILAIVVLHISAGFLNNQGMFNLFVSLPYVFSFFPLIYAGEGVLWLPKKIGKYRREDIGRSFDKMRNATNVLGIMIGIGIVGQLFFLLFYFDGDYLAEDVQYLAIEVVAFVAVYWLRKFRAEISIINLSE